MVWGSLVWIFEIPENGRDSYIGAPRYPIRIPNHQPKPPMYHWLIEGRWFTQKLVFLKPDKCQKKNHSDESLHVENWFGVHHKNLVTREINSKNWQVAFVPWWWRGFSNLLGLFQVIMANLVIGSKASRIFGCSSWTSFAFPTGLGDWRLQFLLSFTAENRQGLL